MSRPVLVAIVGPTAAGKSALGIALARHLGGEIVACDSTAVFRGIDIGTDKVPADEQQGIPHHLVDVADPTEVYSAARYAQDAAPVIRAITARGRMPILVGGTGLYFRALVRGLFPGSGAPRGAPRRARARRARPRRRRAPPLGRAAWIPARPPRIQPRDTKRLVRALEVALVSGVPMTAHFAGTVSPIADYDVLAIGVRLPAVDTAVACGASGRAVQFARGVVAEVRGAAGGGRAAWRAGAVRPRLPADRRDARRRPGRGRNARADRAREPALRPPAVDLVPERAYPYVDRGPGEAPAAIAHAVELVDALAPRVSDGFAPGF